MPLLALDDEAMRAAGSNGLEGEHGAYSTSDALALVGRVVSSPQFSKAPKLQRFLSYVAEQSLAGRLDLVSEYNIGVEVFERRDSYSPGEDNIVRSYARTLRKRLDEYFAGDGLEEPYVILMPRGGYAVEFAKRPSLATELSPKPRVEERPQTTANADETSKPPSQTNQLTPRWAYWAILLFTILISATTGFLVGTKRPARSRSTPNLHRFWTAALGNRQTLIVPSDTGLTIALGLIQKDVSVQDYVRNDHLAALHQQFPELEKWDRPITHRYSDFVDVLAVHQFDAIPEINSLMPTIRYVRDLKADEIEKGNTLLLGGSNANPWVQMFDHDLNFHLRFLPAERTFRIENLHPLSTEQAVYPYGTLGNNFDAYGLVAVMPNSTHSGNVILMEGTTNSGLQAAFASLGNEELMAQICSKVLRIDGSLIPFEMLVKTPGVGGNATRIEILGIRTHP